MKSTCGCCEGIHQLTPGDTANRPGLSTIVYRVGTHSAFLETMKARLSNWMLKEDVSDRCTSSRCAFPLQRLGTREGDDFSIALLDAWATIADVLTFYQERIANEGYLRTAIERYSVIELARLIGYEPRPGVASSVFLAYNVEKGPAVDIPAGSRAQSTPAGSGELPQSFETSAVLKARDIWNNLKPRQSRPQKLSPTDTPTDAVIYFDGTSTSLKPNDRLLFDFGSASMPFPRRVLTVEPDNDNQRTKVTHRTLTKKVDLQSAESATIASTDLQETLANLVTPLTQPAGSHPANSLLLQRDVKAAFDPKSDLMPRLLSTLKPELSGALYTALRNTKVSPPQAVDVYAFRVRASPFGHNAPKKPGFGFNNQILEPTEWPLSRTVPGGSFRLEARINLSQDEGSFLTTVITLGQLQGQLQDSEIKLGSTEIPMSDSISFNVKVTPLTTTLIPFQLDYSCLNPPVQIAITVNQDPSQETLVHIVGMSATTTDIKVMNNGSTVYTVKGELSGLGNSPTEESRKIYLDNVYDKLVPGGWILLEGAGNQFPLVSRVVDALESSRADYLLSGKITEVLLDAKATDKKWVDPNDGHSDLSAVRQVAVFAQSEKLDLADQPLEDPLSGSSIELDGIYEGLESGRWLIVSGERVFPKDKAVSTSKVQAAELVMLAGTTLDSKPGDNKLHTTIQLAAADSKSTALAYSYKRDTVTIYGNVAHATHGETRGEVLGSGDSGRPFQEFQLKQFPITYISAATPTGIEDTLQVRVNDILWHQAPGLAWLGPNDRSYLTRSGDDSKTTVVFGNGLRGAIVPTGVENIKATYRTGIGSSGNVNAGQISMLAFKPQGLKDVTNPIRASGGADRESRDAARRNAPLAVMSLDRLVSIQDYADFARTFGGIGKASATELGLNQSSFVHVTVAGSGNVRIDETSDLFMNLKDAFAKFGDPQQSVQLAERELMLLVISAGIAILPDYQFETVAPKVRAALLFTFSFENRDLGQDILQSEVISTIQNIEGVKFVQLQVFDSIKTNDKASGLPSLPSEARVLPRIAVELAGLDRNKRAISPAQLAFLTPDIPETMILNELADL